MDYVKGIDLYQLLKENKRISERKTGMIIYNLVCSLNALSEFLLNFFNY